MLLWHTSALGSSRPLEGLTHIMKLHVDMMFLNNKSLYNRLHLVQYTRPTHIFGLIRTFTTPAIVWHWIVWCCHLELILIVLNRSCFFHAFPELSPHFNTDDWNWNSDVSLGNWVARLLCNFASYVTVACHARIKINTVVSPLNLPRSITILKHVTRRNVIFVSSLPIQFRPNRVIFCSL